jgi:hypothetical protein
MPSTSPASRSRRSEIDTWPTSKHADVQARIGGILAYFPKHRTQFAQPFKH